MEGSHQLAALPDAGALAPADMLPANLPSVRGRADGRIDEIEVLRAAAVAMVFVEHTPLNLYFWHSSLQDFLNAYWHGSAGVDLFFAISGFVIARRLLPRLQPLHGTAFLAETLTFFLRRFWRLQPSALLWIAVPLALGLLFNRSGAFRGFEANLASALTAVLVISDFRFGSLFYGQDGGIVFPYWSLSLEEQFYLLLPLLVLVFRRRVGAIMGLLLAYQFVMPHDNIYVFTRPGAIAAGVLLAIFSHNRCYTMAEPRFLARHAAARWIGLALVVALLGTLQSELPKPLFSVPAGMVAVLSGLLVYTASFGRGYLMSPGLLRRVFVWIGTRSFAIYLIHIPAFSIVRELNYRYAPPVWAVTTSLAAHYFIEAMLLTLLLAELNYRLVETPGRRYGRTLTIVAPNAA